MGLGGFFEQASGPNENGVTEGIFCDCFGTLYTADLKKDQELIDFLNAQYAAGKNVVLFSADPRGSEDIVRQLGLHPDLTAQIGEKLDFMDDLLEMVIDDDPPFYLNIQTYYHPQDVKLRQLLKEPPPSPLRGIAPPSVR